MKRNLLSKFYFYFLVSVSLFPPYACQNSLKEKPDKGVLTNKAVDDSVLSIYVPTSILDSTLSEDKDFGFHEHYYGSKLAKSNNLRIRYELDLEGGKPKGSTHEVTTRLLVARAHIQGLDGNNKVISIDSIIRSDLKVGIINYSEGTGETIHYTTLAFVPSYKRPWYQIYINYDNSIIGHALKDSVPNIIESISVNGFQHE